MNATTGISVLAIALLIFGNGVFVAAEFSLTALDSSIVDANARRGGRRDRFIQRAQHRLRVEGRADRAGARAARSRLQLD